MSGDSKFDEVASLPVGIDVIHEPEQIKAIPGDASGLNYTWPFSTSVNTREKELTIIEFGCFALIDNEWIFSNYTGEPFTTADFEEWYSCPEATLVKGATYADPFNWTGSNELRNGSMLWYFIGEDVDGNRYQGTGRADYLSELDE
jgi:hypothetical protein